ncbi:MAG: choice-of-anchor D domain-containing protein [Acidobacteriia bacterium]|nr:choice-of-anchor D domain-containing protein [Terriglobia bacterium]
MATLQRFGALWQALAVQSTIPALGRAALAGFLLAGGASHGLAQPALPNQLEIKAQGITMRYPAGWSSPLKRYANVDELVNVPVSEHARGRPTARVQITSVARTDHAEALRELRDIATENSSKPTFLDIGGWPGLQRRHTEPRQQPSGGPLFPDKMVLRITTAVAVGNLLVRVEAFLPSAASPTLIAEVEAMEKSLKFKSEGTPQRTEQELEELRRGASAPPGSALLTSPGPQNPNSSNGIAAEAVPREMTQVAANETPTVARQWPLQDPPLTRLFQGGNGELEIAASPNGRNIVVARQRLFRTSNDGGQTFAFNGAAGFGDGDPSLAWGQSGNFYLAGINTGCTATTTCTGMDRSTNSGQTFPFLTNALSCPNTGVNSCFPDQEHIAADRVNAAPGGGDQVYSVWRNFNSTGQDPSIICSQDSGANWTAPLDVEIGAFVPRVGVGQDGFVYVIYRQGGNIRLHKFSSCGAGLAPQLGFPVTVTAVSDVTCPVAGLDRCNDGNVLSSHTVAVDDTNTNHVYVAYANNTAAGNENILVRDSLDGGRTWLAGRVVTINTAAAGRRFMPWVASTGGEAFVSWYDRRAATPAANDLTEFFGGRARLDALGNLVAGPEFKISKVLDPQCASGWGSAPRSAGDSESCSVQPQLAGVCCDNTQPNCPGSHTRCDFSSTVCPAGETCNTGGGSPKYGDYNGSACAAGRFFTSFASAKSPPEITPPSAAIDVFFAKFLVGDVPQIQVPSGASFGSICDGSVGHATLKVCNTGNANLSVNPITASNPQFAATTPSGGYPVAISPDFCFPFEVTFTPTGVGPQTATLTVPSDDPSTSSVTVQATGQGGAGALGLTPNLRFLPTVIQSLGTCQSSKPVVISNTGTCNLTITNIAIGGTNAGDFSLSGIQAFPITLEPGHVAGSGDLKAVFAPTALARERTANITVTFVSNPATGATSTQTRDLCGEGVRTGARVLVTQGGVPMTQVHEIELKRFGGAFGFANEIDETRNVALQTVTATPGTACASFQFHREWGAISNPTQLVPGVYQLKVEATIAGKEERKVVWFNVDTCGFDGTIVIDF